MISARFQSQHLLNEGSKDRSERDFGSSETVFYSKDIRFRVEFRSSTRALLRDREQMMSRIYLLHTRIHEASSLAACKAALDG